MKTKILTLLLSLIAHSNLLAQESATTTGATGTTVAEIKLDISVVGVKSTKGQLVVLLFDKKAGFPAETEKALTVTKFPATEGTANLQLKVASAGDYAFTVFHDENENTKLETNWIGMPKEGIAVSKDAKGRMGAPKFEDAAIKIEQSQAATVHLKYL